MLQKWNAEIVISAVKFLHAQGEKINAYYVQHHRGALYAAGMRYFGTWGKVLIAADLSYTIRRRQVWSREIILQKIVELVANHEPLNNTYVKENYGSLYTSSCMYFGGWSCAVEAAGIAYDEVRLVGPKRSWNKELVVKVILERKRKGQSLSGTVVQAEDTGLYEAAVRLFGKRGWAKARVAAGMTPIDPKPGVLYDQEVVVEELKQLYAKGVELHFGALAGKPHQSLVTAAIRLFGSYPKALAAAGIDYQNVRKTKRWSKKSVIEKIRALEKAGVRLNYTDVQELDPALCAAGHRLFGTWGQAVTAAGFSYRMHLRIWSTRAWLLTVGTDEYESVLATSQQNATLYRRKKK